MSLALAKTAALFVLTPILSAPLLAASIYVFAIEHEGVDVCKLKGLKQMDERSQSRYRHSDGIRVGSMFYPYNSKVVTGEVYVDRGGKMRGNDATLVERKTDYMMCEPTGRPLYFLKDNETR